MLWPYQFCWKCLAIVLRARFSRGERESGQIPIRLLYCILSSRASNEVGMNISWDAFCKGRSSVIMPCFLNNMPKKAIACLHLSLTQLTCQEILGVLETRWWWEFDQTLSPRESLACETSLARLVPRPEEEEEEKEPGFTRLSMQWWTTSRGRQVKIRIIQWILYSPGTKPKNLSALQNTRCPHSRRYNVQLLMGMYNPYLSNIEQIAWAKHLLKWVVCISEV